MRLYNEKTRVHDRPWSVGRPTTFQIPSASRICNFYEL